MKKIILLFLILHSSLVGVTQILKVDKGSLLLDSSNVLLGNVGLNFDMHNRSATSDKEITFVGFKTTTDLVYLTEKHAYISISNIQYFKSTGGPLSSNGYSHFRINFQRKKLLSYETYTQIQYDNGRNMPFRFLVGGGLRWRILESKKVGLHGGIGAMNEIEHWKNIATDNSIISKQIFKTSDYIGLNSKLNDYINFHVTLYYQGGYDKDDEIFRNRTSVDFLFTVLITNKISFNTSFSFQHEDKPIIPIRNFVYSLHNGIMWKF